MVKKITIVITIPDDCEIGPPNAAGAELVEVGEQDVIATKKDGVSGSKRKPCSIEGCTKNALAKDLCSHHYYKARAELKKGKAPMQSEPVHRKPKPEEAELIDEIRGNNTDDAEDEPEEAIDGKGESEVDQSKVSLCCNTETFEGDQWEDDDGIKGNRYCGECGEPTAWKRSLSHHPAK